MLQLHSLARRSLPPQVRARGVTAVLGPTNTGKTHLAIERMLAHSSGIIGLPLRLLAREVYGRLVERAGKDAVALVTGEEKIKPQNPRYWVSTVEAMPRDLDVAFVAVDEIQLAADLDRGHVFTDRLLNQRGREETLLIGSGTMRPLVEALIPGVNVVTRPRLSQLTFAGEKKLSRLPSRTAIVAFSAEEVYAIAELIRRQRGGAAVVLGALSPRTRNAQVDLYQAGDVDYLVATDAVGMGLNLDVDHVAFAASRKFDGFQFRALNPAEIGQIAGRAGRHLRDGTFGTTGRCEPFEPELVQQVEAHAFEPLRILQWRNPDLDFATLAALQESLAEQPREQGLIRAPTGEDVAALEVVAREPEVRDLARGRKAVERLWEVCQVPDYRKVAQASHADLVSTLYRFIMREGAIPPDWFQRQLSMLDRTDGDIDTLSNRIAQVRTWSFVANRPDWLRDPEHWQAVTRGVEDKLSDALHERLASRFVDRRTSVLMRRLRENTMLEAEISAAGDVTVEGQHVGHLHGFQFVPDPQADNAETKTLRNAASKALAGEIETRAERFSSAADTALVLSNDGTIRWTGDPVAKLEPGDKLFDPKIRILADEQLTGPAREKVETRLRAWLKAHIVRVLGPVLELESSAEIQGIARGIAFQVAEALGVLERSRVQQEVRSLSQEDRGILRNKGIRFGAYHIYLPALLKPAPRLLAAQLWALQNGGLDQKGLDDIAHLASSGRTSIPVDTAIAKGLYRAAGFRVCGARAVRVDILERLADLIRPAIAYRPGVTAGEPPAGAADGEGFVPTVGMTSLVGCSGEDFASILKSLGYVVDRRPGPAITVAIIPAAPTTPVTRPDAAAPAAEAAPEPAETAEAASSDVPPDMPPSPDLSAGEVAAPVEAEGSPAETAAPGESTPEESAPLDEAPVEAAPQDETASAAEAPPAEAAPAPEAIGEPAAAPVEAAAEPQPDTPAEPVLIEVWRQHRHQRDDNRRPARGERRPGARPEGGERSGAPRGERPRHDRSPRPDRPPQNRPGGDRPQGDRPPREERRAEGSRPEGGRPDNRPPRGGRPDDRRGPPREDRRPEGPRPERRERQPDPNSPFAKLLELKAQLERDKR
ncbi:helicase-related protein [Salinarimonas soli]|uniref:Helicase n=1 Tax=Salinarimonas soli TaxID=1638099 RepID=A0A5B2VDS7_9HYPH|nr:helicase-related protein [Salinarimonas soli]KAA2237104.1 helicase [Salinarimonas soli]